MTIYFARVGQDGPIKIGFTAGSVAERVADLQCGCPWPLTIMHEMPGDLFVEAHLHDLLDAHRMEGEWFKPSTDVLALVGRAVRGELVLPTDPPSPIKIAISIAGSEE